MHRMYILFDKIPRNLPLAKTRYGTDMHLPPEPVWQDM